MREMRRTRRQISQVWTLNRNLWINFEHLMHPNVCGMISYERLMVWVLSEVQRHQHRILRTSNGSPHVTTSKSPSLNKFFIFKKNILVLIQGLSHFSKEMTVVDTKTVSRRPSDSTKLRSAWRQWFLRWLIASMLRQNTNGTDFFLNLLVEAEIHLASRPFSFR